MNGNGRWSRQFQFQTGAIKSRIFHRWRYMHKLSFNSKLVRLKGTAFEEDLIDLQISFNSKLVRLEDPDTLGGGEESTFQFQTGSIKSHQK